LKTLQIRNDNVTEYNIIKTALLGCNTCDLFLSSGETAKVALFYILDYMTKDPVERSSTLPLALAAKTVSKMYSSIAQNKGTGERRAQHING